MRHRKNKKEFSKSLLIQESALIWITSLAYIVLAFYCISNGYTGSLPWITASASLPWAAYGVSQVFYYKKSMIENSKNGIKYETVLKELDQAYDRYHNMTSNNTDFNEVLNDLFNSSSGNTTTYTDTQDSSILDTDYGI